jgi:di/tricarboxylate transporter
VVVAKGPDGVLESHASDVIVLAAGVPALQQLLRSSPVLAAAGALLQNAIHHHHVTNQAIASMPSTPRPRMLLLLRVASWC